MKKLFILSLLFIFITSCKNNIETPEAVSVNETIETAPETTPEKEVCKNEAIFGDTTICLPEIEGIIDGYKNPKIKAHANQFADDQNIILAYYLTNETYEKADDIENTSYDNYYKVYAANAARNYNMTMSELNEMMKMMTGGFLDKTMEDVNKTLDNNIQLGQPILIDRYSTNSNSSSLVILMDVETAENSKTLAVTINALRIKNRLVFMAHYLNYKDEKTFKKLKENTTTFINSFIETNY